jgi:hypothetical protein
MNMDPLTPTTSTLAPAISHIADTAAALSSELAAHVPPENGHAILKRKKQRDTVAWILATPDRLEQLLLHDKREEAQKEWDTVRALLDKWQGVRGVASVRDACEKVLSTVDD